MLQAMAIAFATVFIAELGDKSQLLALSLSARYGRRVLLAAVVATALLTTGASVLLGDLVGRMLPLGALRIGAAVLFLGFAVVALRGSGDLEGGSAAAPGGAGGFLGATAALSLAELGDKTMVATFALAATSSPVSVWLGAALGMAAASALAVLVGGALWKRVRPRTVRLASAALFAVVGAVLLVEAALA